MKKIVLILALVACFLSNAQMFKIDQYNGFVSSVAEPLNLYNYAGNKGVVEATGNWEGGTGSTSYSTEEARTGTSSLKYTTASGNCATFRYQGFYSGQWEIGDSVTYKGYFKATIGTCVKFLIYQGGTSQEFTATGDWAPFEVTMTSSTTARRVYVYCDGTVYLDDIEVINNTNPYGT